MADIFGSRSPSPIDNDGIFGNDGDDREERVGSGSDDDDDNNTNGQGRQGGADNSDEEENNKKKAKPKKPKGPVRRQMISEDILGGKDGLRKVEEVFKDFQFRGKGKEKEDLSKMLSLFEHWIHTMHPKHPFDQSLERIEFLGLKKKPVKTLVKRIRMGLISCDDRDDKIEDDVDDEMEGANLPEGAREREGFAFASDDEMDIQMADELELELGIEGTGNKQNSTNNQNDLDDVPTLDEQLEFEDFGTGGTDNVPNSTNNQNQDDLDDIPTLDEQLEFEEFGTGGTDNVRNSTKNQDDLEDVPTLDEQLEFQELEIEGMDNDNNVQNSNDNQGGLDDVPSPTVNEKLACEEIPIDNHHGEKMDDDCQIDTDDTNANNTTVLIQGYLVDSSESAIITGKTNDQAIEIEETARRNVNVVDVLDLSENNKCLASVVEIANTET